jgi:hypothetical protein
MNVRKEVLKGFLFLAILLLIGGLLITPALTPPTLAQQPIQPQVRDFTTWATIGDGLTAYTYITNTTGSELTARVTNYGAVDFIVKSTVAAGATNKLAVTAEFSNDGTNFATATNLSTANTAITYTGNLTPTGALLLHVPVMGEFVRLKLAATGANTVVGVTGRLVPVAYLP